MVLNMPSLFNLFPSSSTIGDGIGANVEQTVISKISGKGEGCIFVPLVVPTTVTAGTWEMTLQTSSVFNTTFISTATINEECAFIAYLDAGTYSMDFIYRKTTGAGILTLKLDATTVLTLDMYAGASSYNNISTTTGIVIVDGGFKAITLLMASKNVLATDYGFYGAGIVFRRTA